MLFLVDTSDLDAIREAFDVYPLAGVTTNPTNVAREGIPLEELIERIRGIVGPDPELHVQVLARDTPTMVEEARAIWRLAGPHGFVKVPVTRDGLAAIRRITAEGIPVTATAVFTLEQAVLAARAGAAYVAPYVNRLDEAGGRSSELVAAIVDAFAVYELPTRVLGASFRSVKQVHACLIAGAHACTMTLDVLNLLVRNTLTEDAVESFERNWQREFGDAGIVEPEPAQHGTVEAAEHPSTAAEPHARGRVASAVPEPAGRGD